MAVSVIEALDNSLSSADAQTVTFTATPQAGDVLVVMALSQSAIGTPDSFTISGTDATWEQTTLPTPGETGSASIWTGTGATAGGTVTVTATAGDTFKLSGLLLRGLNSTAVTAYTEQNTRFESGASGVAIPPGLTVGSGQFVAVSSFSEGSSGDGYTLFVAPASGWTTYGGLSLTWTGDSDRLVYRSPAATEDAIVSLRASSSSAGVGVLFVVVGDPPSSADDFGPILSYDVPRDVLTSGTYAAQSWSVTTITPIQARSYVCDIRTAGTYNLSINGSVVATAVVASDATTDVVFNLATPLTLAPGVHTFSLSCGTSVLWYARSNLDSSTAPVGPGKRRLGWALWQEAGGDFVPGRLFFKVESDSRLSYVDNNNFSSGSFTSQTWVVTFDTDVLFEGVLKTFGAGAFPYTLSIDDVPVATTSSAAGDRNVIGFIPAAPLALSAGAHTFKIASTASRRYAYRSGTTTIPAGDAHTTGWGVWAESTSNQVPARIFYRLPPEAVVAELSLDGTIAAPVWGLAGAFDLDATGDPATVDFGGVLAAPAWGLSGAFSLVPLTPATVDLVGTIMSPVWGLAGEFDLAPRIIAEVSLDGTITAPAWGTHADFALQPVVTATTLTLAGELTAPAWMLSAGFTFSSPPQTDTSTRIGGRDRSGYAAASWEPPIVPPPVDVTAPRHVTVSASAFGPVTMVDTQPTYTVSAADKTRMRTRILVGGKDVSFLDEVATPEPSYQLAEPLRWGPCTIELPQIPAAFANPGVDDLSWCAKGKRVVLQRVNDETGTIVATDYRGVVIGYDVSGPTLRIECGGHASGRAALRLRPAPIFRHVLDLGHFAWEAIQTLGLRFEPRLGPTTGIKSTNFGGADWLTYIQELCGKAWDRDGTQWTIRPSDAGVYRMQRKDTTTVDFTIFTDDTRAIPQLRSDAAEEPNRIFASGTTPKGQRVRFGVYPGLKPGQAAPYPFTDGHVFGTGTTDADTDTGDGITVMVRRLWHAGYLSLEDADGVYDADVKDAIADLQEDVYAGDGAVVYAPGVMDPDTWAAMFDVDTTGYEFNGARVEPAAQAPETRRYKRSAAGAILGKNPAFDPSVLISDRELDFGSGFTRHQMRKWARAEIARGEDNWVGTITIKTGAVLHGHVAVGATITADDLADVRAIEPGTNAWLPQFAGGILVHISAVEISYDAGVPQATLTVDTQARDAVPVWEIIRRDRESRRDPARRWHPNRASGEVKDAVVFWDEVGGVLYGDETLEPGWNVVPVVAGQEGTVARIRLIVQTTTVEGATATIRGHEFACAVFGQRVTAARLKHLIGNPLAATPESTTEPTDADKEPPETDPEADESADPAESTTPVRPWWERKDIRDELRDLRLLYSAGTREEPCGYSPGRKTGGATRTGMHRDDAGFSYQTGNEPVLYVAVWVWGERTLSGGRVMWNQLEAGA